MRAHFFRIVSEDDLMDRLYNVMKDTGVFLSLDLDLRQILYLSNIVERDRIQKQKNDQLAAQLRR